MEGESADAGNPFGSTEYEELLSEEIKLFSVTGSAF